MPAQRGLFTPVKVGPLELPNRIVMAPIPRLPSMPNPCLGVPRNGFCAHHR